MDSLTDQDIILKIRKGDTASFRLLVERYQHMIYTSACKLLKSKEDAEEVAQDIFLKAFTSIKDFRGDAKFSTWLYKIAYHKCLDHLKKKKGVATSSIDGMEGNFQPGYNDSGLEKLERLERKQLIKETIDELPADDGWIITMFYLDELSLKEIAKITGRSPNSVKVRLFRARERLLKLFKEKLEPDIIAAYEGRSGKKSG